MNEDDTVVRAKQLLLCIVCSKCAFSKQTVNCECWCTKKEIKVDSCYACEDFITVQQILDREG